MSFFNIKGIVNPLTALGQFGKKPHTLRFPDVHVEASDRYVITSYSIHYTKLYDLTH